MRMAGRRSSLRAQAVTQTNHMDGRGMPEILLGSETCVFENGINPQWRIGLAGSHRIGFQLGWKVHGGYQVISRLALRPCPRSSFFIILQLLGVRVSAEVRVETAGLRWQQSRRGASHLRAGDQASARSRLTIPRLPRQGCSCATDCLVRCRLFPYLCRLPPPLRVASNPFQPCTICAVAGSGREGLACWPCSKKTPHRLAPL